MIGSPAPYKNDTVTVADSYARGFAVGQAWTASYRPGGPWVPSDDSYGRDADWSAYCKHKRACHEAWLNGFDAGRI